MDLILGIVGLIFALLQIILFFKLWGMTNDVKSIKDKLYSQSPVNSDSNIIRDGEDEFKPNDLVINLKEGGQMYIGYRNSNGNYECYVGLNKIGYKGSYTADEIRAAK